MRISDWSSDVCSSDLMQRDRRSDRQINEAFGHFIALKVGDGVGRQMEADVADQHQAAARKRQRSTARRAVAVVALQRPLQLPALLSEAGGKRALDRKSVV